MRRTKQLCLPCSKEIDLECTYDPGRTKVVEAKFQYNQLGPMCDRHFLVIKEIVEKICKTTVSVEKYRI